MEPVDHDFVNGEAVILAGVLLHPHQIMIKNIFISIFWLV